MKFIGEIAALAAVFFLALTALIFTSTGRSVGSQVTNRMRLLFALLFNICAILCEPKVIKYCIKNIAVGMMSVA